MEEIVSALSLQALRQNDSGRKGEDLFGKPPEVIPEDLTANQYYELCLWYEEKQMHNLARKSCQMALDLKPDDHLEANCKRFLNTRVPRNEVPQEAIDRLRRMEPRLLMDQGEARKLALKIVADYPDFEWPQRVLADIHLREGDIASCKSALEVALKINPEYTQAFAMMARALTVDMEYEEAQKYLQRAQEDMPGDGDLRRLQRALEFLIALDDVDDASTVPT